MKKALISVSDKTGVAPFAHALEGLGWEIISTGGTAKALKSAGVRVTDISDFTGFPEILEGRLKTLHPKVHGGILGLTSDKKHAKEMADNGIEPIDVVCVNLYPFEETVARPDCRFEDAIENIDIGGPAMVRSAAKNHARVAVVVSPSDYEKVVGELKEKGAVSDAMRFALAKKAFALTARYDSAIATHLNSLDDSHAKMEMPDFASFTFKKVRGLRYGENPHQKAAFYRDSQRADEPSLVNAKQLQGKELSYNNIMDADAALDIVKEFSDAKFAVAIVKHASPCGVGICVDTLASAYAKALECDPVSAFGGIVGCSRDVDAEFATVVADAFYEVIAAPSFTKEALEIFGKKKNLRLLQVNGLGAKCSPAGYNFRKVAGGLLLQERDLSREDVRTAKVVTKRKPTDEEWRAMAFAWRVCKHVKSNAIVYALEDRTLGIGAGQTSRIDSARIAGEKMQRVLGVTNDERRATSDGSFTSDERRATSDGIAVASDAFFPFRDGIDEAAKAGATACIQPGGSIRDEEVIKAADEHGLAMVFTGVRHFKH